MKIRTISAVLTASLALQAPTYAQSIVDQAARPDRRATVGLTIPFGSSRSDDAKPRIDLRFRSENPKMNMHDTDRNLRKWQPDTRIGFTLDKKPKLMLNGRIMAEPDGKARMGTVGYIAIGTVVVLVVGGALAWDALRDASD